MFPQPLPKVSSSCKNIQQRRRYQKFIDGRTRRSASHAAATAEF
jgi:hypothetical protein